jgi:uroporphyrinogen decarboxylase
MGDLMPRERVLAALKLEEPDQVPYLEIWVDENFGRRALGQLEETPESLQQLDLPGSTPTVVMEFTGGNHYTPVALAKKMGLDGFWFFMMPPVYEHVVKASIGRDYSVGGKIKTREDLKLINLPDPNDEALYDPARQFLAQYQDSGYAVFAISTLGMEPLRLGMGTEHLCLTLYDDPGLVIDMLDLYTDWLAVFTAKLCQLGFDFVWMGDDLAFKTAPFVSPRMMREVFLPRFKKVADKISLPWIFHSDGNLMPIVDDLLELGMNGLHPLEPGAMDIVQMKQRYGKQLCLVGNIDLRHTLVFGTPAEVEAEVRDRVQEVGRGGGYIISSANSIASYCRVANVLAIREAIRKYGQYPL